MLLTKRRSDDLPPADPLRQGCRLLMLPDGADRWAYEDAMDRHAWLVSNDTVLQELELARCFWDFYYWARTYAFIEYKGLGPDDPHSGRPCRLLPNGLQVEYEQERRDRNVILKQRKGGCSTWIDLRYLWRCRFRPGTKARIVADSHENAAVLFERVRYAWDQLPDWMKLPLRYSSKKELAIKGIRSHLSVLTAGNPRIGRGADIDCLHLSECAFYPNLRKIVAGAGQALRPGAWIDWESTANGYNEFRDLYENARRGSNYVAHFFPWWIDKGNRATVVDEQLLDQCVLTEREKVLQELHDLSLQQLQWRRFKIQELGDLFPQEFPENDKTCFLHSGVPKFNVEHFEALREAVIQRVKAKPFEILIRRDPRAAFLDDGHLTIWVAPKADHRYVIGADVAEGLPPDGDYSAGGVLDVTDAGQRQQVAEWHGWIKPGDFGHVLSRMGIFYNQALVAVERNNHGHAVIRALRYECGYAPMYRHKDIDQLSGKTIGKFGFPTTAGTRQALLDRFSRAIVGNEHIVRSAALCGECLEFQAGDEDDGDEDPQKPKKKKRKNDRVFAWSIADWAATKGRIAAA